MTTRVVRSRDIRPPRYVTETNDGLSGWRSAMVRVRRACSSLSFGGKNSNETVRPAARSSAIRAISASLLRVRARGLFGDASQRVADYGSVMSHAQYGGDWYDDVGLEESMNNDEMVKRRRA